MVGTRLFNGTKEVRFLLLELDRRHSGNAALTGRHSGNAAVYRSVALGARRTPNPPSRVRFLAGLWTCGPPSVGGFGDTQTPAVGRTFLPRDAPGARPACRAA